MTGATRVVNRGGTRPDAVAAGPDAVAAGAGRGGCGGRDAVNAGRKDVEGVPGEQPSAPLQRREQHLGELVDHVQLFRGEAVLEGGAVETHHAIRLGHDL